jgi:hypothetical protein
MLPVVLEFQVIDPIGTGVIGMSAHISWTRYSNPQRYQWVLVPLVLLAAARLHDDDSPVRDTSPAEEPSPALHADAADKTATSRPKTETVIRGALEDPKNPVATGDPILDGVIEVIQQQGSLVDRALPRGFSFPALEESDQQSGRGSTSDRPAEPAGRGLGRWSPGPQHSSGLEFPATGVASDDLARINPQPYPPQNFGSGEPEAQPTRSVPEQNYLMAEQLLMTARLLNQSPQEGERRPLIEMLRREAARCLNSGSSPDNPYTGPRGGSGPQDGRGPWDWPSNQNRPSNPYGATNPYGPNNQNRPTSPYGPDKQNGPSNSTGAGPQNGGGSQDGEAQVPSWSEPARNIPDFQNQPDGELGPRSGRSSLSPAEPGRKATGSSRSSY